MSYIAGCRWPISTINFLRKMYTDERWCSLVAVLLSCSLWRDSNLAGVVFRIIILLLSSLYQYMNVFEKSIHHPHWHYIIHCSYLKNIFKWFKMNWLTHWPVRKFEIKPKTTTYNIYIGKFQNTVKKIVKMFENYYIIYYEITLTEINQHNRWKRVILFYF